MLEATVSKVKLGTRAEMVKQIRGGVAEYLRANAESVVAEEVRHAVNGQPVGLSPADVSNAIALGGYGLHFGSDDETLEILVPDAPDEFKDEYKRLREEAAKNSGPGGHPMFGPHMGGLLGGEGLHGAAALGVPGPGSTTICLPDGSVISLADWVYGTFRSACVIDPWQESGPHAFELFSYGRAQQIAGTFMNATAVHTNIPRNGDNGLPRDWEMLAYRWNAMASLPLDEAVMEFAQRTTARFKYNDKHYRDCLLSELLLGGGELAGDPGTKNLPVHLREHLSYGVTLEPESPAVLNDFRAYLRGTAAPPVDPVTMAELEMLARQGGEELRRVVRKIKPGKTATFWVQLGGYVKRTVV